MKTVAKKIAYRRKSAPQRRRELIQAGITCLGKGGMSAFTIDQICKQAGVSRGLINHHFKTKEDLLVCIYANMTDHLVQDYKFDEPERHESPRRSRARCPGELRREPGSSARAPN